MATNNLTDTKKGIDLKLKIGCEILECDTIISNNSNVGIRLGKVYSVAVSQPPLSVPAFPIFVQTNTDITSEDINPIYYKAGIADVAVLEKGTYQIIVKVRGNRSVIDPTVYMGLLINGVVDLNNVVSSPSIVAGAEIQFNWTSIINVDTPKSFSVGVSSSGGVGGAFDFTNWKITLLQLR